MDAQTVASWRDQFDQLMQRFGPCFARRDLRGRAGEYLQGLTSDAQRKNSWQIAERLGEAKPYAMQRLLGRARWNAEDLRDELIRYAKEHLLDGSDPGILIVDESGFPKRGDKSAGVQRQYCGSVGAVVNCQVGVFLTLASSRGRMLIDRELYLPKSWCQDPPRCQEAGIPTHRRYARKAKLAMDLLARSFAAGISPRWVLADEVYGGDGEFRAFLEKRNQPYVLAVSCRHRVFVGQHLIPIKQIPPRVAASQWQRLSIGQEADRAYDFAALPIGQPTADRLQRWLLIRRHLRTGECGYYLCLAPGGPVVGNWLRPAANAGRSKAALSAPRGRRDWTITRCVRMWDGTATSV